MGGLIVMEIGGYKKPLLKVGTVQTVNVHTGKVISARQNTMSILPCKPDVCQECGTDHAHDQPHNQQSLVYQYRFYATHERWPTWSDAMAHCTAEVRQFWRSKLIEVMTEKGLEIPEDLRGEL